MARKLEMTAALALSLLFPALGQTAASPVAAQAAVTPSLAAAMPLAVKLDEKDVLAANSVASRYRLPAPAQAAEPARHKPAARVARAESRVSARVPHPHPPPPNRHYVEWTPRPVEPVLILGIGF